MFTNYNQMYGFALSGASRTLYQLKNIDCCYLVYPNNIDHYLSMLLHDQPSHILGLGSYFSAEENTIHVEIGSFLKPTTQIKYASKIDNLSPHLVSQKIMELIKKRELHSQYTFLNVPKSMKPWSASRVIDEALLDFRKQ